MRTVVPLLVGLVFGSAPASALDAEIRQFRCQEIERELGVGYAVSLVDVNGDGKLDIVVVDQTRVVWYENPAWRRRTIIENQTKPDNVCIAPYDLDGDGQIDFALGADWRPADTVASGTIQWLSRGPTIDDQWTVHAIGTEPTVHRMRWGDFDGDGRAELIVLPLHGRGVRPPEFNQNGVRVLLYKIPKEPTDASAWKAEIIDDQLHVSHNLWPVDLNQDRRLDLLVASFEGVSLLERAASGGWSRRRSASAIRRRRPIAVRAKSNRASFAAAVMITWPRLSHGTDFRSLCTRRIPTMKPRTGIERSSTSNSPGDTLCGARTWTTTPRRS